MVLIFVMIIKFMWFVYSELWLIVACVVVCFSFSFYKFENLPLSEDVTIVVWCVTFLQKTVCYLAFCIENHSLVLHINGLHTQVVSCLNLVGNHFVLLFSSL